MLTCQQKIKIEERSLELKLALTYGQQIGRNAHYKKKQGRNDPGVKGGTKPQIKADVKIYEQQLTQGTKPRTTAGINIWPAQLT